MKADVGHSGRHNRVCEAGLDTFRGKQPQPGSWQGECWPSTTLVYADTLWDGNKVGKEDLKPGDVSRRLLEPGFSSHGAATAGMVESWSLDMEIYLSSRTWITHIMIKATLSLFPEWLLD